MGIIQRAMVKACPHIWFERSEVKDRHLVAKRYHCKLSRSPSLFLHGGRLWPLPHMVEPRVAFPTCLTCTRTFLISAQLAEGLIGCVFGRNWIPTWSSFVTSVISRRGLLNITFVFQWTHFFCQNKCCGLFNLFNGVMF